MWVGEGQTRDPPMAAGKPGRDAHMSHQVIGPDGPGTASGDVRRKDLRRRPVVLFLSLLVFWFLFTGAAGPQQIISGAIVSGLLTVFWASRLSGDPGVREAKGIELPALTIRPGFLTYALRMVVEIVKANWAVALIVLDPRLPISPHFVIVHTKLVHLLSRVVYANSITVTPGTISVSLEGDTLVVHAITREAAEGVAHWKIEDRIQELERPWAS